MAGAVAGLLLAAACSDDATTTGEAATTTIAPVTPEDGGDATTTTSTEAPVELTASWPGVTEDTIHLGLLAVDWAQLLELGVVDLDPGDAQLTVDTFVGDLNARGGIHGRRVEAHVESVLPIGTNEAEAACLALTEDIQVFAVLGAFVGPSAEANPCITDLHETIMIGGLATPEQLERARAPWLSTGMSQERRLAASVSLFDEAGLIGDNVAVAVNANEMSLADDIVIPALEAHGYEGVLIAVQDVPADDISGRDAKWDAFLERFRADGIDTLIAIETESMGGANAIATSDLDVQVLLADGTNYLNILGTANDASPEQLAGVIGTIGATPSEIWEQPSTQECVDIFETAHPDIEVLPSDQVPPGETTWISSIVSICRGVRLFEAIAIAAGPELTHDSFVAGAESLGEIDVPGLVFASLGPGKLDVADAIRLGEFDPTVDEDGGSKPYGPLTRFD